MNEIRLMALGIEVGQSSRHQKCPKCKGGVGNEASFVVSRVAEGILYNCHRNSCSCRGIIRSKGWAEEGNSLPARGGAKKARPFTAPTRLLREREYEFFRVKYGLEQASIEDCRWAPTIDRVLIPFYDARGRAVGCNARGYSELAAFGGAKSIVYYNEVGVPLIDFCLSRELFRDCGVYTLVEDGLSARKIRQAGFPAIALNGTHLSDSARKAILAAGVRHLLVWLDSDANSTARKLVRSNMLLFSSIQAHLAKPASPDPKEHTKEQIQYIIGNML